MNKIQVQLVSRSRMKIDLVNHIEDMLLLSKDGEILTDFVKLYSNKNKCSQKKLKSRSQKWVNIG